MRVLIIHNAYGRPSGEEAVVAVMRQLLLEHGHTVDMYERSSAEIPNMLLGRARAFFAGVYSTRSRRDVASVLEQQRPDIVNIHNVFPLISPSVLMACREAKVPVVMTVHNYRLICPNGLLYSNNEICERCLTDNEWACVKRNCEASLLKSSGYALRNAVARRRGFFRDQVTIFAALTEFQKDKLVAAGFAAERIVVVGNGVPVPEPSPPAIGDYVGYCGRVTYEKGGDLMLELARACPDLRFKVAGHHDPALVDAGVPDNVEFTGYLQQSALQTFYEQSRFVILPSRCYEGLPMTILEAMARGKAVIGPRHGGIPEIIVDGETGVLFEPGKQDDLRDKVTQLWNDPDRCLRLGAAGYERVSQRFGLAPFYQRLETAFERAMDAKGAWS